MVRIYPRFGGALGFGCIGMIIMSIPTGIVPYYLTYSLDMADVTRDLQVVVVVVVWWVFWVAQGPQSYGSPP